MRLFFLFLLGVTALSCSNRPGVEWKFKTQAPLSTSPAISGNKLIISGSDHYLYALDLKTGKVIWKTDLGDRIMTKPLAEGNNIYVGTASGYFYQINAGNGNPGWKFRAKGIIEYEPCADADGIYFGSYDGNFYKIDRQGKLIWLLTTGHQVTSSCTFYKDRVITTSWDTHVYSLRRDTGEPAWKVPTGEFAYGNGVVLGDSVFFGTHGKIYRIDAETGKVLFEKEAAYNTHLLAHENFIYTQEHGLTKRTPDGQVVKTAEFNAFAEFAPSVVRNYIVASDGNKTLYGVSTDLEILWKFRAKDIFWSTGVFHDGIYYVGNRDSYVYALKLPV